MQQLARDRAQQLCQAQDPVQHQRQQLGHLVTTGQQLDGLRQLGLAGPGGRPGAAARPGQAQRATRCSSSAAWRPPARRSTGWPAARPGQAQAVDLVQQLGLAAAGQQLDGLRQLDRDRAQQLDQAQDLVQHQRQQLDGPQ